MTTRVVLATRNPGKLREMQTLLAPLDWTLIGQAELDIPSAPEDGLTFIENALGKARHVAALSGLPCLADDSGLVVPALAGAPGIHSARYAGEPSSDQANNNKLLAAMKDVLDRSAHFYCALVFLQHAHHPAPEIACGRWNGRIGDRAVGENGFGYDPVFIPDGPDGSDSEIQTAAELPSAIKNERSHRGQAVRALLQLLTS